MSPTPAQASGAAADAPEPAGRDRPRTAAASRGLGLLRLVMPLLCLLAWEVGGHLAGSRLLPPLSAVLVKIGHEAVSGALLHHLGVTLLRVLASFALAMVFGAGLGLAMGRSRRVDALFDSLLTALLNLPALVGIVLLFVWFGLSETTTVAAVALNKLPNTAVTVREGARALDARLIEMGRSFRFGRWTMLRHVVLPQLYPYLIAAARSGLALIWKIVLVAELLGRSDGVGFEMQVYFQLFDVTGILAYALAFIAVVQAIEWLLFHPLERRAGRWR